MRLYEKYRPRQLADVLGRPKAVETVRRLVERSAIGGRAFWISGASGTGKTTLARIIAGELADPFFVREYDSADQIKQAQLEEIETSMGLCAWGLGGRAWIINEAHGLRAPIVRQLLGLLERLPDHCVFIFTTTKAGESKLFEDEIDAGPLLSRCLLLRLTNQGLAEPFAAEARRIAQAEGLDGKPPAAYVRLLRDCQNNLRAAIERIEAGAML